MSLPPGARLGACEIVAPLGAGGMGEVYRARDTRDTRVGRDVAIKILPGEFSSDQERLTRFEQEARASAALNHPNILALFDVGQHQGAPFIVSELLEGQTLRERLGSGALPVRKVIDLTVQITHGLAAAHDKNTVPGVARLGTCRPNKCAGGAPTRFTLGAANERTAIWSPDGERVVFNSNRETESATTSM